MKPIVIAASLTASLFVVGAANAADLRVANPTAPSVRIAVAGKSADQLNAEIKVAAANVCHDAYGVDSACVTSAVDDANDQLKALQGAHRSLAAANIDVLRAGPETVRIATKGKSPSQLNAEIAAAAATVCKTTSDNAGFDACVEGAISDAKDQMRGFAQANLNREYASN